MFIFRKERKGKRENFYRKSKELKKQKRSCRCLTSWCTYTTNDKYCNQSQNRLNLNILLRDHDYPAYFLIDYTFSRMCSYLQTMLVQNWLRSYQLNFLLYKHHVSLRIFILIFHFEATNTFFHHQYIFHLLMDCLSNISKHDTFTCQKGYKKEPHSPFHF